MIVVTILVSLFCIFLIFLLVRSSKKLLEYDELFELFAHDIETNSKYLIKLLTTPLYSNSSEILEVQRNLQIIEKRLAEYSRRIEEISQKIIIKKEAPPNPPVLA